MAMEQQTETGKAQEAFSEDLEQYGELAERLLGNASGKLQDDHASLMREAAGALNRMRTQILQEEMQKNQHTEIRKNGFMRWIKDVKEKKGEKESQKVMKSALAFYLADILEAVIRFHAADAGLVIASLGYIMEDLEKMNPTHRKLVRYLMRHRRFFFPRLGIEKQAGS